MQQKASTLNFFWQLASLDPAKRLDTAVSLLSTLAEFQEQHVQSTQPKYAETLAAHSGNQDDWKILLAEDVSYAIIRLIKGLSSARDGARQGFSLALSELLASLPFIHLSTLLPLLSLHIPISASTKGAEQRDSLFGKLFFYQSIIQSSILTRSTTTPIGIKSIIDDLLGIMSTKSYLVESCVSVLLQILGQVQDQKVVDWAIEGVLTTTVEGVSGLIVKDLGVNELWFVVACQQMGLVPSRGWKGYLDGWSISNDGSLICVGNVEGLADILKESTITHPSLHSIWPLLISIITSENPSFSIQDFWKFIITPLFQSTHERKYLAFQIFQRLLPLISKSEDVATVFSGGLVKCLVNSLGERGNYLWKVARQTVKLISTLPSTTPTLSFQIVLQLLLHSPHFDQITKTSTISSLLVSLDIAGVTDYIKYLENLFLNQESEHTSVAHRCWILDQLAGVLRNSKVPKGDWRVGVVEFFCRYGFFDMVEGKDVEVETKNYARVKFFGGIDELCKSDPKSPLHLLNYIRKQSYTLANPLSEQVKESIQNAYNLLSDGPKTEDKKATELQNLVAHLILQSYNDPHGEYPGILDELVGLSGPLFDKSKAKIITPPSTPPSKIEEMDVDAEQEESEEPLTPTDILIDICVGLLSKPSSLLRDVGIQCFKVFCQEITSKGMEVIFSVLSSKEGLFDLMVDDEDEEEEDEMEIDDESWGAEPERKADAKFAETEEDRKLLAKIKEINEANAQAANNQANNDDSDDEEGLDDDQMEAFDEKLVEIFKEKKRLKSLKKATKQQTIHFKLRILDLLEVFIKNPGSPPALVIPSLPKLLLLALESVTKGANSQLVSATDDAGVHDKMVTVIGKVCKMKYKPADMGDEALKQLELVLGYAARFNIDNKLAGVCSGVALWLIKIVEEEEASRKKNKKDDSADNKISPVAAIYLSSLEAFLTKKNSRLRSSLFTDLANKYSKYTNELLPYLSETLITFDSVDHVYQLVEGVTLISKFIEKIPKAETDSYKKLIKKVLKNTSANVLAVIQHEGVGTRRKDILKQFLGILRCCGKFFADQKALKKSCLAKEFLMVLKNFEPSKGIDNLIKLLEG